MTVEGGARALRRIVSLFKYQTATPFRSRGAEASELCARRHRDEGRGRAAWRRLVVGSRWLADHRAGTPDYSPCRNVNTTFACPRVAGLDPATHRSDDGAIAQRVINGWMRG